MTCIFCGAPIEKGSIACYSCGRVQRGNTSALPLDDAIQRNPLGIDTFGPNTQLLIQVNGAQLIYDVQGVYTLGRILDSGQRPDIDLTHHGAYLRGVSRLHAQLSRVENRLLIADLNSTNGTFLNGVRIEPNNPTPVHDGDHVALGSLSLNMYFR